MNTWFYWDFLSEGATAKTLLLAKILIFFSLNFVTLLEPTLKVQTNQKTGIL